MDLKERLTEGWRLLNREEQREDPYRQSRMVSEAVNARTEPPKFLPWLARLLRKRKETR